MKITYLPTPSEAEGLAAQHLPAFFKGREQFKPALVHSYRTFIQTSAQQGNTEPFDQHVPALFSAAAELKDYIHQEYQAPLQITDKAQKFLDEISMQQSNNNISPVWLIGAYLRYAAALSNIGSDERDLLLHLVNPSVLKSITATNEAWAAHVGGFHSILIAEDLSDDSKYSHAFSNLHGEIVDLLKDELAKSFPSHTVYPFAGIAKFGVSFLIGCYLDQVFPIGLPPRNNRDNKNPGHGTRMSRVTFSIHDVVHADLDPRENSLEKLIYYATDAFVEMGGNGPGFIKFYTPIAVRRYMALMACLKAINHAFLSQLLPYAGKEEYKKAMLGFFLMTHEYAFYNSSSFTNNDLADVIHKLVAGSKSGLLSNEAWESSYDPLQTSPFNGASTFSEAELINYAFNNKLVKDNTVSVGKSFYSLFPQPPREESIRKLVHRARATPSISGRFIDIEFDLRTGQKKRYTYPTLFLKWHNIDDSLGLLKMAGVKIAKPDIAGLELPEARKVVTKTLNTVRSELMKLIDHFESRATFFATQPGPNGTSMADRYFQWQFKTQTRLDEVIDKVVPKPTGHRMTMG